MVRLYCQFGKQLPNSTEIIIYEAKSKIQIFGKEALASVIHFDVQNTAMYFDVWGKEASVFILCIELVPSDYPYFSSI